MEISDAYTLITHAITSGHAAHGYLVSGAIREACLPLLMRVLSNLFPGADAEIHPDIHWIRPESKARTISVGLIREKLITPMESTAFSGGWRVGVIVGADRLNSESTNAFLKTLEEPPAKTIFFLLTDAPERLLSTIISRCQRIDLKGIRSGELAEPYRSAVIAALCPEGTDSSLARLTMAEKLEEILVALQKKAVEVVDEELEKASSAAAELGDKAYAALISARYREFRVGFLMTISAFFAEEMRKTAVGNGSLKLYEAFYDLTAVEEMARSFERNMSEAAVLAFFTDRIRIPHSLPLPTTEVH